MNGARPDLRPIELLPDGASHIVPLDNAVAVVSTNTWAAIEAAKNVGNSVCVNPPNAALLDSNVFKAQAMHLLGRGAPYIVEKIGDVDTGGAITAGGGANVTTITDCTFSITNPAGAAHWTSSTAASTWRIARSSRTPERASPSARKAAAARSASARPWPRRSRIAPSPPTPKTEPQPALAPEAAQHGETAGEQERGSAGFRHGQRRGRFGKAGRWRGRGAQHDDRSVADV